MTTELLATLPAVSAFGVAVWATIDLPSGEKLRPTAAFAAPLASLIYFGQLPALATCVGCAVVAVVVGLSTASPRRVVVFQASLVAVLLWPTGVLAQWLQGSIESSGARLALATIPFVLGAAVAEERVDRFRDWSRSAWREAVEHAPIYAVLVCSATLLLLIYDDLGVFSFLLLVLPVLAIRYEFTNYVRARRLYHQTVRALARLTEGTGRVRPGHQERVSRICRELGTALSLPSTVLLDLELAALMHEVGVVRDADQPLPDEEAVGRSSQIMEQAGLGGARILEEAVSGEQRVSLEAQVFRAAHAIDSLQGSTSDRVSQLARSWQGDERVLVAALDTHADALHH